MKNIVLTRIDDRLIHGQVVTHWCKSTDTNLIVIVDDQLIQDSFTQRILKAAAPPLIKVEIFNIQEGVRFLKQDSIQGENIMILTKIPQTMEALIDNGIPLKKIILGGMVARAGRKRINKNIHASDEEIASIKNILAKGTEMWYQLVPVERAVNVKSFL